MTVMLRFHNTLGIIFGAGMNTVRSSGFSRSASGRGNFQRSRLKAELLTNDLRFFSRDCGIRMTFKDGF